MKKEKEVQEIREERFIAKEGEITATRPQCKDCVFSVIDKGLSCTINKMIPLDIRLNKATCKDFKKAE